MTDEDDDSESSEDQVGSVGAQEDEANDHTTTGSEAEVGGPQVRTSTGSGKRSVSDGKGSSHDQGGQSLPLLERSAPKPSLVRLTGPSFQIGPTPMPRLSLRHWSPNSSNSHTTKQSQTRPGQARLGQPRLLSPRPRPSRPGPLSSPPPISQESLISRRPSHHRPPQPPPPQPQPRGPR